ncbi:MAG: site-specific integrase [Thermoguttaceae bacterium]
MDKHSDMSEPDIKVTVVKYPDRKFLMMRYTDPITGKQKARSTGTTIRREAERIAAKWEQQLQEGRYQPTRKISWADFRERYESEKLSSLAESTQKTAATAMNHLERVINPLRLASVTTETLSLFQSQLRKDGMKETTIGVVLSHLRPALSWAVSMEMLPKVPDMHRPKGAKGHKLMRGRPITAEEFERMLTAVPKIRKRNASLWSHYLTGLWLSGLRLEESTILSWDDESPISVDLSGRHPRFRIYAEAEKGRKDRLLPMTPDLDEFILKTPKKERQGPVFKIIGFYTEEPVTLKRISRTISAIGKKAGVVVNKTAGKYASAHDLRRSFGTRWASRVKPATLQLLMRHKSIETTLKYYVDQDADDVADELWKAHRALGNTLGNTPTPATQETEKGSAEESTEPLSGQ